jgi:hypothetical protein
MGEGQGGGGQNRLVPPPLHPLPRWGGEAFREIVLNVRGKFPDFNEEVSNEPKGENSKQNRLGHLELGLGNYLGFGIWNFRTAGAVLRLPCDRSVGTYR